MRGLSVTDQAAIHQSGKSKESGRNIKAKIKDKALVSVDKKITDILYPIKKATKPEDVDTEVFRAEFYENYKNGKYDSDPIDIDVKEQPKALNLMDGIGAEINIGQIMGGMIKSPRKMKKMTSKRSMT